MSPWRQFVPSTWEMEGMLPAPKARAPLVKNAKMTHTMRSVEAGLVPRRGEAILSLLISERWQKRVCDKNREHYAEEKKR